MGYAKSPMTLGTNCKISFFSSVWWMQFGNPKKKSYIKIQMKINPIKDLKKYALSKQIETQYKISFRKDF